MDLFPAVISTTVRPLADRFSFPAIYRGVDTVGFKAGEPIMQKAVSDALFGLAFGMGFCLAQSVLQLIATLISHAH